MKMYLIQSPVHIQDEESPCGNHLVYANIIILKYYMKFKIATKSPNILKPRCILIYPNKKIHHINNTSMKNNPNAILLRIVIDVPL